MKLSLALPVYNGANYLSEALESAIAQGPELTEIVVSDNCSSDSTPDIVIEFARRDSRVRHERSNVFLNQADNVTRSISLCRNEWVQLLCHDDLLRPGAIAALSAVIGEIKNEDCALISHLPCHLFSDGHTYRHVDGMGRVESKADLMGKTNAFSEDGEHVLVKADTSLGESMRKGDIPYLPAVTTAAVRRTAFLKMGGFDPRWVHFDVFFWVRMIQEYDYLKVSDHWTLTRVHAQQVAVLSRKNQRSYRDFRDFYAAFLPEAKRRYRIGLWPFLKLRLKPLSQASAPLVVAMHKRQPFQFLSQWMALPVLLWLPVLPLACANFFREKRRNAQLWEKVSPSLTYE